MKIKCIEQSANCIYQKQYGDNFYCEKETKPNHKWINTRYGPLQLKNELKIKKRVNTVSNYKYIDHWYYFLILVNYALRKGIRDEIKHE